MRIISALPLRKLTFGVSTLTWSKNTKSLTLPGKDLAIKWAGWCKGVGGGGRKTICKNILRPCQKSSGFSLCAQGVVAAR